MESSSKKKSSIQRLNELHKIAWIALDQALKFDEQKKYYDAIQKYKEGLNALDEALKLKFTNEEWFVI